MTSPFRLPLHNLDPTGATDQNIPVYDAVNNRVTWARAPVEWIGGGPGISIDRTDPHRPIITIKEEYQQENPDPTGLLTITGTPVTTEVIIDGMDISPVAVGKDAEVAVNLWTSMSAPGVGKACVARLRDGGLTGTVLATYTFPDTGDSVAGHSGQWNTVVPYVPATTRVVCTIQTTASSSPVYSDARYMSVTQFVGRGLDDLNDVNLAVDPPEAGEVLGYDGEFWGPVGHERIVVVPAGAPTDTAPAGCPPRALIVRRLP